MQRVKAEGTGMEEFSGFDVIDEQIELPPGFRFHPTDEELITHYLSAKVIDCSFSAKAIGEVDLNKVEPWDLPWKAKMGEKEWYFFCLRDRKYPTGLRTNRATEAGYWKATGKDKEIFREKALVGMKKTLVFYRGRAPRGEKTNWVMHEYRLEGEHATHNFPKTSKNEWVICRIFKKSSGGKKVHISGLARDRNCGSHSQSTDLPTLMDISSDENQTRFNDAERSHVTCFSSRMEDARDKLVDEFSSSTFKNSDFPPFIIPQVSTTNSVFSSQTIPRIQNLHYPDSSMIQDQSILRLLIENNGPYTKQIAKSQFSYDTAVNTNISSSPMSNHELEFKPFEDQEFSAISTCPVDLDCLWNY